MQNPPRKPRLPLHTLCVAFLITLLPQQAAAACAPHHQHPHWSGQVQYWHLQRMNASCYPRDSCRVARRPGDGLHVSHCLCSRSCADFDACCVDSPYRFYRPHMKVSHSCVRFPSHSFNNHAFMVDQCRPTWTGDFHISSLCNGNAQELNDPMLLIPVTHRKTGITYRNYFCAVCNDETNLTQNVFWNVRLSSSSNEIAESSASDLRFDPEVSSWVIHNEDTLVQITLQVEPPEEIGEHVTICQRDVISDCDPSWPEDDSARQKCASYMAIVAVYDSTLGHLRFRNVHCAICNGYRSVTCVKPPRLAPRRPLSFALLLDVNPADGERVGEIQKCPDGVVWDPFFKKCRVLQCALPGYVIRDGRCVKL